VLSRVALVCLLAATAASAEASADVGAPTATLRLKHRVVTKLDPYIEGAYYYASLRRTGFTFLRRFSGARMVLRVPPGRYVLRSYARPCDANCSRLDRPTDGCATKILLRAGTTTRVRVVAHPTSPCRLRVVP
jgi:hypothetical protein